MAILCPIGLKIGLPIILRMHDGQNKFEVCISKKYGQNGSKMAELQFLANLGMAITWPSYIRFGHSTPLK